MGDVEGHAGAISSVLVSSNGKFIVTGGGEGAAKLCVRISKECGNFEGSY